MDNAKILELVDRIEAAARELAEGTGERHISIYVFDGYFGLESSTNDNGQKTLSFFRGGAKNE